jgi:hypothetical protein
VRVPTEEAVLLDTPLKFSARKIVLIGTRYATAGFRHEICAGRYTTAFRREGQENFPVGTSPRLSERRAVPIDDDAADFRHERFWL